jgi:hypothetical protein
MKNGGDLRTLVKNGSIKEEGFGGYEVPKVP